MHLAYKPAHALRDHSIPALRLYLITPPNNKASHR
jgi:hypothetical protein